MAKTGKLTTNKYDSTRYYELVWEITGQDNNANQSTIKWTLYARGGSGWYSERTLQVVIADTTVINKTTRVQRYAGEVASGTMPVTHNADGSKAISASIQAAVYGTGVNVTGSGKWSLDPIARGAYITSAPDFTDEINPTIYYNNPFGEDVEALEACISFTGAIDDIPYRAISKTGTYYSFILSSEELLTLRKGVTSGNSTRVIFYLRTKLNGETYWNTSYKTFTLTGDLTPIMEVAQIQDVNPATSALIGNVKSTLIAGYSNLAYEFEASAKKAAEIQTYTVKCDNYSSHQRIGVINGIKLAAASKNIVCTATDSRGYSVKREIPLTLINYYEPTCFYEPESLTTSSGNVYFDLRCFWWDGWFDGTTNGANGGVKNSPVVQYRYRTQNEEEYSAWFDSTDFHQDEWGNTLCSVSITGLDYTASYIVQVRLTDKLVKGDAARILEDIPVNMVPVFDWSREDFAINVPLRVKDLDSDSVNIKGKPIADFVIESDSASGWHYRIWNSGLMECWTTIEHTTAVSKAWGSMYVGNTLMARQNYPVPFSSKPTETATLLNSGNAAWLFAESQGNGVNGAYASAIYNVCRPSSITTSQKFYINIYAVGYYEYE
jgi:hypothetical protein